MGRRKSKTKLIAFLFVALVFMGIGYATLQNNLNVSGTAKSTGTFDVYISNAETDLTNKSSGANSVAGYPVHTRYDATLQTSFTAPGDYITYNVTVVNGGTIDALIKATLESSDNLKDSEGNDIYLYEVEYENGKKLIADGWNYYNLDAGITTVLKVTITYNEEAVDFPDKDVTFVLTLDVTQKSSPESKQEYRNFMEAHKDFELDENGKIIAYNPSNVTDKDGYIVVGATNYEDRPIVSIGSNSFALAPNVYVLSENELYIDYPRGSNEFNKVKEALAALGFEEDTTAEGTASNKSNIKANYLSNININPKLKKIDTQKFKMYGKGEIEKPTDASQGLYVDPITGSFSFGGSSSITKLDLSNANNLETIENSTFNYNSSLQSIKFPTNGKLKTIGSKAFYYASGLTGNITLPNTIQEIGDSAFEATTIGSITLPSNLKTVGKKAFKQSQLQGSMIIPSGVISIGESAFEDNRISGLSFESESHLTEISASAFKYNQIEGTLEIPSSVTSIGSYAFYVNNSLTLTSLTIPSSVTNIGSYAFSEMYKITNLSIDMETTPSDIFTYSGIENLTIGSNVKTLQGFIGNMITSIDIPNSVTNIGYQALSGNQLSGTIVIPSKVTNISDSAFANNKISNVDFSNTTNLQTIGFWAFQQNNISSLEIPSTVTTIEQQAFDGNTITSVNIPSSVTYLGSTAFDTVTNLTIDMETIPQSFIRNPVNITFGSHVRTISNNVFGTSSNIANLGTVIIPSTVTSTNFSKIFEYCKINSLSIDTANVSGFSSKKIQSLVLGPNVRVIETSAFYGNKLSGVLKIPAGITSIGEHAFSCAGAFSNNQLSGLEFENNSNLQKIGNCAFRNNQLSGTLTIPNNVDDIDIFAFEDNQIQTLIFENNSNLKRIAEGAFMNNQISGTLTIPDSVESIMSDVNIYGAFQYNKIQTLNIGSGLTRLEDSPFTNNVDDNNNPTITKININMTESTWNSRNLPTTDWYNGSPKIEYNPE